MKIKYSCVSYVIAIYLLFINTGCKQEYKKLNISNSVPVALSVGKLNEILVVIPNDKWEEDLGETIRNLFALETLGLPQQEPIFDLKQVSSEVFTEFHQQKRAYLNISIDKSCKKDEIEFVYHKTATPQLGVYCKSSNDNGIKLLLENNNEKIIKAFKTLEKDYLLSYIVTGRQSCKALSRKLKLDLKLPKSYRKALEQENFFWYRKTLPHADLNLVCYLVNNKTIPENSKYITREIIKVRDSINSLYIPVENNGKLQTERAYTPYLVRSVLDTKKVYVSRGTWEIKNQFLAGPFVNYTFSITDYQLLVIEGFVLAPATRKRDYIFELESLIQSISFLEK